MQIKPEEVSWAIKEQINNFDAAASLESVGHVLQVGDGIAKVWGLHDVMMSELVEFPNGTLGMVLNLESDSVGVVIMGSEIGIKEQDLVKRTKKIASVPVGEEFLGRVVNALAEPVDGKGPIRASETRPLEGNAPNVVQRQPVHQPVQTGIKAIDAMLPIGKGQRELIIGDRQTGKTAIIIDTIINQKGKGIKCIYVAIGQKTSTISRLVKTLEDAGAMEYTTIISAPASDPAPLQYLAPYTAVSMGEYYMYKGEDAICFYDDLSKHAQAYRQIALLLRRPPGREAYPGDIFYLHSRLLERGAKLSKEMGGGSLTAIPVIETQANDVTTYIPTNVISITDGQIFLEADLFYAGIRPAINVGISASRVGGKAQTKAMKKVAHSLRLDLAQYRELAAFVQFGSELDESTLALINRGERMVEILKQTQLIPYPLEKQVMILFAGAEGFLDDIPLEEIKNFEAGFLDFMERHHPGTGEEIADSCDLSEKTIAVLREAVQTFKQEFISKQSLEHG